MSMLRKEEDEEMFCVASLSDSRKRKQPRSCSYKMEAEKLTTRLLVFPPSPLCFFPFCISSNEKWSAAQGGLARHCLIQYLSVV